MKRLPFLPRRRIGFTLVEVLVSIALLALLLLILISVTNSIQRTWSYTNGKIEEFRNAREAFESMTRRLSQATLNTYLDYHYPNNDVTLQPDRYVRQSELRFISGNAATLTGATDKPTHALFFQAALGFSSDANYSKLNKLLNTWGYFIEFGDDSSSRPAFIANMPRPPAPRYRFRLMELMEPSDSLSLYTYTSGTDSTGSAKNLAYDATTWFTTPLAASPRPVRTLAENIVALVFLPKLAPQDEKSLQADGSIPPAPVGTSLSPHFSYDSTVATGNAALNWKNQLPPIVQVTMVAVDEASFNRFQSGSAMPVLFDPGLFTDAANYDSDLKQLESALQAKKLNYRVFTIDVSLKTAKWSRDQAN